MGVRERILSSATKQFARRGFDGTSLQSIVDEVGVKKQSLLYYFPSKQALRQGVLDTVLEHWASRLPKLLGAVSGGRDRFEVITAELIAFFREDPDRARLLVRELMDRPEEMRARVRQSVAPWIRLVADNIRRSQEVGDARADVNPESYVVHVVTTAISAIASWPVLSEALGSEQSAEAHLSELTRLARVGLFSDEALTGRE